MPIAKQRPSYNTTPCEIPVPVETLDHIRSIGWRQLEQDLLGADADADIEAWLAGKEV